MEKLGKRRGSAEVPSAPADAEDSLYQDLVEKANDLFIVVGGDGRVRFVNQSYCRLTGIAREEIEGERIAALFDAEARQDAQNRLTWALQSAGQNAVNLPLRKKDGKTVDISFRPSAERGPDNAIRRMVLVGQSPFLYGELAEQFNSLNRNLRNRSLELERLNAELEQRITERTARLAALLQVSASLNAQLQLDALFELILRQAIETIPGAEAGALLLYDPEVDRLKVQAACGYDDYTIIQDLQAEMERVHPQSIFVDRKVRVWAGETRAKSGQMRHLLRNVDQFRIRSAISAPIATPSEKLGVLLLHNFDVPNGFTEEDVELAASLAGSAAIAITNAKLYDETRWQNDRLELVNRLSAAVRDSLELDQTLKLAVDGLAVALEASRAAITLFDESVDSAVYSAQYGEPGVKSLAGRRAFLLGTPIMREVLGFRETRAIVHARTDPRVAEARHDLTEYGVESLVIVPLLVRDRFLGVVELHQCDRERRWRPAEINLAESVAKQVATAVHQVLLHTKLRETVRESQAAVRETTALYEATSAIASAPDLELQLDTIARVVHDKLGWSVVVLSLVDESRRYSKAVSVIGLAEEETARVIGSPPVPVDEVEGFGERFRFSRSYFFDHRLDPKWFEPIQTWTYDPAGAIVSEDPEAWHPDDALVVPITLDGRVLGRISVDAPTDGRRPTLRKVRQLELFADQAAVVISQAHLFEQVSRGKREWEATFDAMSDAVFMFDSDKRLARANGAASELEGRPFRELTGVSCCEVLADVESHECMVERAMRDAKRLTFEWSRGTKTYSITVDPLLTEDGRAGGAVAVVRDLSLLREAERESQRQQEFLTHVIENAYDVISLLDTSGLLLWHNRAMLEVSGFSPDELRGVSLIEMLAPDLRGDARASLSRASAGDPQIDETVLIDRGGHERDLVLTLAPVYEAGSVTSVLVIGRDVTEEKRAAEKAAEADKLRALGQLASGVAHDFNNILAAVLGRAQLLKSLTTEEPIHRGLDIIEKAALDGAATVKRIQNFAHQRTDSDFAVVDVNGLVLDAIEITRTRWRNDAQSRGVQYDIHLDQAPGAHVLADDSELREVFVNLIINAVDAMPEGGRLDIAVSFDGGEVKVTFADTGVGMTESVRRRIFEPFFTTKGAKGTGLGLAVSYGIVIRHQGRIEAESESGAGAVFSVVLPIAESEPKPATARDATPSTRAAILVIDDEPAVREVLVDMLVEHGQEVEMVDGGAAGLARLAERTFDVVFTDLSMPGMDGWAVAREVKHRFPGTKVVLVTGYAATLEPTTAELTFIDAVVAKPFDFDRITDTLEAVLAVAE